MKRNIKWIEPEETIDSGESAFVDNYLQMKNIMKIH